MVSKIRGASGVIKLCGRKGTKNYKPEKRLAMRDVFSSIPPKRRTGHSDHQVPTQRPLCFHATVYSEACCLLYLLMGISAFSLEGNSEMVFSLTTFYMVFLHCWKPKLCFVCRWHSLPFVPPTHCLSPEHGRSLLEYSS